MAGLRKLLLLILPVLVALAAHYHRQGSLVLPPQLAGPTEELWQQLRGLPFQVSVALHRDSSAAKQAGGSSAPAQVGVRWTQLPSLSSDSTSQSSMRPCMAIAGRQAGPQQPAPVLPLQQAFCCHAGTRVNRSRRYRLWQIRLTLASARYPARWMT